MIQEFFTPGKRGLRSENLSADLVVVGGGVSGICTAVTAARAGTRTILIQDRPVLGGNASSEVRLWILGATSHMGNNNRWSREGGLVDEILVENTYRNPEGNPVILDTILLEKVRNETNITLLLNTAVFSIEKYDGNTIAMLRAFCSQNSTFYDISGRLFCDASGDGILAYLAGAAYRMGAEETEVYGEKFAPDSNDYGSLLGSSIYFYSKDTGKPVRYIPPSFALKDITAIPRWERINAGEHGCKFWWLEYGGRLDTIHDAEDIKWELWKVVYGVWDHIKNSGRFPEAENLTLEWVGLIPGKRESRRFVGEYTLIQQDIVEQRPHYDNIAFGGWAIDLHPADGVYSTHSGCIQYHSKGVYGIPYRCFVSRDIRNLFYAGRCMSASHVAHGSSRVMATSGFTAQAVGMAAAQCIQKGLMPADIAKPENITALQQALNLLGQSIPGIPIDKETNLAASAKITATGELSLSEIPFDGPWTCLDYSAAQILPMKADVEYGIEVELSAQENTILTCELRYSGKPGNYTPDVTAERLDIVVAEGISRVHIPFSKTLPHDQYGFVVFIKNDRLKIRSSEMRITGIVSVFNKFNDAVNNNGRQDAPGESGLDSFEFWCPDRRPEGRNIAMKILPAVDDFGPANTVNGYVRPTVRSNAWVADPNDIRPALSLIWNGPVTINCIILYFDTDYDHAMESVQMGHPENVMPFCVRDYRIRDGNGTLLYECTGNHQTVNTIEFASGIVTDAIRIEAVHPSGKVPASIFQIVIQ